MALIQWDESFEIKFREIDDQHKRLVAMANDLHDAMREGKGKQTLGVILNGLAVYTKTHFETEERYFRQFEYPETAAHVRQHDDFVRQVDEFRAAYESGRAALSVDVMNFLSDWLTNHIKGTDKKYARFLLDAHMAAAT